MYMEKQTASDRVAAKNRELYAITRKLEEIEHK